MSKPIFNKVIFYNCGLKIDKNETLKKKNRTWSDFFNPFAAFKEIKENILHESISDEYFERNVRVRNEIKAKAELYRKEFGLKA